MKGISRRDFLRCTAGGLSVGVISMGPFFLFPERAQARLRTLRILQWKHFVPDYDRWFDEVFTKQWGQKHNTKVIVDHVPFWEINARAEAEIKARQGHDLVMFPSPPARYEKHVINHAEIYQAVAGQQGQVVRLGHRSTFNPKTKKYFAFADSYVVAPFNYVKDYWEQIGFTYGPSTYDSLRLGAKQIRDKLGIPCGLGLAAEPDSNIALHGVLWSFGGSVQDARGQVTINSKGTIEALKYVKALYQESGTADLFNWHPDFTDQALLNGRVSCAIHAIGIARHADRETPDVSRRIRINAALRGPEHWLSCAHITSCYAVWEHAQNKEDAKQFLVDLADTLDVAFKVSGFCNFPCFPKMVPDLKVQLENDPTANPPHKYAALQDALLWTMNIGHPGYATAAIDEVFQTFVIPNMFAAVAKGALSPEEAASAAEKEVKRIFEKWDE